MRCPGAGACRHHAARRLHGATRRRHRLTFGLLPATAIPALPSFESTLADQPVITSLPLPTSFNTNLLGSTISTTLLEGRSTIDPLTGEIAIDVTFHTKIVAVPNPFLNVSGTCTYRSPSEPLVMHLRTAPGAFWNATTFAFTLTDTSFAVPTPACDDPTLQSLITNAAGDTSAGHNTATIVGTAARPKDAPPPPPPVPQPPRPPGSGSPPPSGGAGGTQTGGDQTGSRGSAGGSPAAGNSPATHCLVPKLKGRTLAAARRALKRAGCRLGTVAKRKSPRRRGTVVAQSRRAGKTLPHGAHVAVTIAKPQ